MRKKNYLLMILFFPASLFAMQKRMKIDLSSALEKFPTDCIANICSFSEQKDIFKHIALVRRDFKTGTDTYLSSVLDNRDLNLYCSSENEKSVLNLVKNSSISHGLHLLFKEDASQNDVAKFLVNLSMKKKYIQEQNVKEVSIPSCSIICHPLGKEHSAENVRWLKCVIRQLHEQRLGGKAFFSPLIRNCLLNRKCFPNLQACNFPNLKEVNYEDRDSSKLGGTIVERLNTVFSFSQGKKLNLLLRNTTILSGMSTESKKIQWEQALSLEGLELVDMKVDSQEIDHICSCCTNLKFLTLPKGCVKSGEKDINFLVNKYQDVLFVFA